MNDMGARKVAQQERPARGTAAPFYPVRARATPCFARRRERRQRAFGNVTGFAYHGRAVPQPSPNTPIKRRPGQLRCTGC